MRAELKGKLETAKELLFEVTSITFIMRVTRLSLEQIKQLQKEIAKSAEISEK